MKIETFNIQHGGGTRVQAILDSISKHNPDMILLTEFRENKNGAKIKRELSEAGYLFQASGGTDPKINTVLFASKYPFEKYSFHEGLGQHDHRLISIEFLEFHVVGFYFPLNQEKRVVFERLVEIFQNSGKKPLLALGDLNTGKHYLDEGGNTFIGSEYIDAIEENGVDVWRKYHGEEKEFSWYSHHGNGFRIDHAFATAPMEAALTSAYYSHSEREAKVSDHSALLVEFKIPVSKQAAKTKVIPPKKSDFRSKFPAEYRAVDGHYVRSKAEMLIDNWLYMARIVHVYEKKLPVEENLYSDFFLPDGDVYIEYWGYENEKQYLARKKKKIEIYRKYNFNLIELEDDHVRNLDDVLPDLLREFGVRTY